MPIPTDTYWNIRRLNVVFAISAVALMGTLIWATFQDFAQPWRAPQRDAKVWEAAMVEEKLDRETTPEKEQRLRELDEQIKQQQAQLDARRAEVQQFREQIRKFESDQANMEFSLNTLKANVGVDEAQLQDAITAKDTPAADRLRQKLEQPRGQLARETELLWQKKTELTETKEKLTKLTASVAALEKEKTRLTADSEALRKKLESIDPDKIPSVFTRLQAKGSNVMRATPLMQFINPSERVQQVVLPDVRTSLGGVKEVETIDRCITCHVNINRKEFAEPSVVAFLEEQVATARNLKLPEQSTGRATDPAATRDKPGAVAMPEFWHLWAVRVAPEQVRKPANLARISTLAKTVGAGKPVRVSIGGKQLESFNYVPDPTKKDDAQSAALDPIARDQVLAEVIKAWVAHGSGKPPAPGASKQIAVKIESTDEKAAAPARVAAMKYVEDLRASLATALPADTNKLLNERYRRALVAEANTARKRQGLRELDPSPVLLAHPRLDLYVDVDSKHSFEAVGCTSCHDGSGQETNFVVAAHVPRPIWVDQKTGAPVLPAQLDPTQAPKEHHGEDLSSMLAAVYPHDALVPDRVSNIHLAADTKHGAARGSSAHGAAAQGTSAYGAHGAPANSAPTEGAAAHGAPADGAKQRAATQPATAAASGGATTGATTGPAHASASGTTTAPAAASRAASGTAAPASPAASTKPVSPVAHVRVPAEPPVDAKPVPYFDPVTGATGRAVSQMSHWIAAHEPTAPRSFALVYHEWDWPMRPPKYLQANCVRCHTDVNSIKAEAPQVFEGRSLFINMGCVNCHQMDSIPAESLPPQPSDVRLIAANGQRKVGTDLRNVTAKLSPSFLNTWIWAPKAFRPSTKMPHFFMLENNSSDEELRRTRQEARAITEYLVRTANAYPRQPDPAGSTVADASGGGGGATALAAAAQPALAPLPPRHAIPAGAKGSVEAGKVVFNSIGCLGCHTNLNDDTGEKRAGKSVTLAEKWIVADLTKSGRLAREMEAELGKAPDAKALSTRAAELFDRMSYNERQVYITEHLAPDYAGSTAAKYPDNTPKPIFQHHGPELSGIGTKLTAGRSPEQARAWLFDWVKEPRHYSEYTVMPSLRLSDQQALDLSEYLLAQKRTNSNPDDGWRAELTPPDTQKLIELTAQFLRSRFSAETSVRKADEDAELTALAAEALTTANTPAADAKARAAAMSRDERRMVFLGKRLISHYGCMSCHAINGAETLSSPCANLSDWGQKGLDKLDFGYLDHHKLSTLKADVTGNPLPAAIPMVNGLSAQASRLTGAEWRAHFGNGNGGANAKASANGDGGVAEAVTVNWPHVEHSRTGWLTQKLKNTRIYDRGKVLLEPVVEPDGSNGASRAIGASGANGVSGAKGGDGPSTANGAASATEGAQSPATQPAATARVRDPGKPYDKLKMPTFYLNDREVDAIVTWVISNRDRLISHKLATATLTEEAKRVARGRQLVQKYNCLACHQVEQNAPSVQQYYKPDELTTKAPPSLRGQGNKIQHAWLFNFLKNVEPLRPLMFNGIRMPSFPVTDEESTAIAAYFAAASVKESKSLEKTLAPVRKYIEVQQQAAVKPVPAPTNPTTMPAADAQPVVDRLLAHAGAQTRAQNYKAAAEALTRASAIATAHKLTEPSGATTKPVADRLKAAIASLQQNQVPSALAWPGDDWYLRPEFATAQQALRQWALDNKQISELQLDPARNRPDEIARNLRTVLFKAQFIRELYDAPYPFVDSPRPEMADARFKQGESLFYEMQCLKCHVLGDATAAGATRNPTAPNLTLAHRRLQRRWVRHWVQEPAIIQVGTAMPPFFTGLGTFDVHGQTWPRSQGVPEAEAQRVELAHGATVEQQADLLLDFLYAAGVRNYTGVQPAGGATAAPTPAVAERDPARGVKPTPPPTATQPLAPGDASRGTAAEAPTAPSPKSPQDAKSAAPAGVAPAPGQPKAQPQTPAPKPPGAPAADAPKVNAPTSEAPVARKPEAPKSESSPTPPASPAPPNVTPQAAADEPAGKPTAPQVAMAPAAKPATPALPAAPAAAGAGNVAVRGTVTLNGKPPEAKEIDMSGVKECAAHHADPVPEPAIAVDDKGNLANVVVYVSGGLAQQTYDPPAEPAVLDQKGCMYVPHVLPVMVGQKITVKNSDAFLHNVHALATTNPPFNFGQPNVDPGKPVEPLKAAESFRVKCDVHPWMSAYVVGVDNPFFAASGADGAFAISNLPPGDYTLTAWHEQLGTKEVPVKVEAGKPAEVKVRFDAP